MPVEEVEVERCLEAVCSSCEKKEIDQFTAAAQTPITILDSENNMMIMATGIHWMSSLCQALFEAFPRCQCIWSLPQPYEVINRRSSYLQKRIVRHRKVEFQGHSSWMGDL